MSKPNSTHSNQDAEFTVGEHKYKVMLLNVREAFKLQVHLGNQVKGLFGEGKGEADPDVLWDMAEKMLKFSEVDGYPLDMEEHFVGRLGQLDLVVIECLKANAPDFFAQFSGLLASALKGQFGSASIVSESTTSSPATATSAGQ